MLSRLLPFLLACGCLYTAADFYFLHGPVSQKLQALSRAYFPTAPPITAATAQRLALRVQQLRYLHGVGSGPVSNEESLAKLARGQLAHQTLVRQARLAAQPVGPQPSASSVEMLAQDFQRDLEASGKAAERMTAQGLTPESLRAEITEDLRDVIWLEQQLTAATATEQEAQAWFQAHSQEFTQPERWQVAHLFLSGHQKPPESQIKDRSADMQQLWQRLQHGEAWESLCHFSEDERSKRHAGQLGWVTAERCPSDFISHLRRLRVGQTSDVVATKLGWHIIQLLDYQPAKAADWKNCGSEIHQRITQQKRAAALQVLLQQWQQENRS